MRVLVLPKLMIQVEVYYFQIAYSLNIVQASWSFGPFVVFSIFRGYSFQTERTPSEHFPGSKIVSLLAIKELLIKTLGQTLVDKIYLETQTGFRSSISVDRQSF